MNLGAQTRIPEVQKALTSCKAQCAWFRRFRMMGLGILRLRSRQRQLLKCITSKKTAAQIQLGSSIQGTANIQMPISIWGTMCPNIGLESSDHIAIASNFEIGFSPECLRMFGQRAWHRTIQDCVNPYPVSPFDITTVKLCKTSCMFINHIM